MSLLPDDYIYLQKMMNESPRNKEVIQKLMDSYHYTISQISHEIRNPLTLIYSSLQMIESQHPETLSFKYWAEIKEDVEFTIQLLKALSLLNNSNNFHKTRFSSYDFLSRCCLSFASSCEEDVIEFSSTIPRELPEIIADKLKLKEVLFNLLKNAKESIKGPGQISLHASVSENFLLIQVSDTGCGIPEEHMETLFDPFVTYKAEGTGLGLAIVKNVISRHGGTVQVESTLGEGTCFSIELPFSVD